MNPSLASTGIRISLVLLLALTGCCTKNSSRSSQTLTLALSDEPASLDPRSCQLLRDIVLVQHLYEGLTRQDGSGTPQLALAEKIESSPDRLHHTIYLRESYWSNGARLKAEDFIYAWQSQRLSPCPLTNAEISSPAENIINIELRSPLPQLLQILALPSNFPICKEADLKKEKTIVSNGPFKMKYWKSTEELALEKNPLYWDAEHVYLEEIVLPIIQDPSTEFYLFEKGNLDWLGQPLSHPITKEIAPHLKEEGLLSSYPVAGTFFLRCNTQKEPFDNPELRKAFAYAIPRQKIISHILQGNQQVATKLVPQSENGGYFSENSELAKQIFQNYLKESGKKFPTLVFSYPSSDRNSKIAQFIKDVWEKTFGISLILDVSEKKYFREKVAAGSYQIATGDWIADFDQPQAFLDLFKEDDWVNQTHWHNSEYSTLLKEALLENEGELRDGYYQKAEAILMEEMPIIPIYHYCFDYVNKDVEDYTLSALGTVDFKSAKKSPSNR